MSKRAGRKTHKKTSQNESQEIGQVEDDLLNILDELQNDDPNDPNIEPDDICCEIDGGASDDIEFIDPPRPQRQD